jgi:hypothetical protein
MRIQIVRALATSAAAAMLAGGAAVASTGTAFAAPTTSVTHAGVTTSQHAPTQRRCRTVKGYYKTVTERGRMKRVWVKPHRVCTGR